MKKELPSTPLRATVLSPSELDKELAGLVQQPHYDRHAVMTGLPDASVRLLESSLIQQRAGMSLYETPGGKACALLWVQAGPMLLRILVALGTPTACDWLLEGLQKSSFLVALDARETNQLVVVQAPVGSSRDALTFAQQAKARAPWVTSTPDEFADLVVDVRRLVQSLLLKKPESAFPGTRVEDSFLALAAEVPMPLPPAPTTQSRH